jgi:hypothetical protein
MSSVARATVSFRSVLERMPVTSATAAIEFPPDVAAPRGRDKVKAWRSVKPTSADVAARAFGFAPVGRVLTPTARLSDVMISVAVRQRFVGPTVSVQEPVLW